MDKKDRLAFEVIRDRARDRSGSPEVGGIREWFEVDRLVGIIEKMQQAPVYVVMSYWNYAGGRCHGAFLDKEKAISVATSVTDAEYVKVQAYVNGEEIATAYYEMMD